ncbi:MAG: hybrid sensor histidine kinase/response regulator [Myxococcales bacterium]|nr:hybrid sensor histidine kinase/response regulator [Myxococcales bacterium]
MSDKNPAIVLIVDDAPENVGFLHDLLTEHGYRVLIADEGPLALDVVERILPDLILLDVSMPGMDGFETCERLKQDERSRDVPVVFMTARAETAAKVRGFAVGGVDYVTKPVDGAEVLARVGTHVALRRARAEAARHALELEARHRESETLSRLIAHHLKQPLTALIGGLETLHGDMREEPLEPADVAELQQSVGWLEGVSRRMQSTIDGLLLLTEVDRQALDPVPVDMGYALGRAREQLQARPSTREARLRVPESLPRVLGTTAWLVHLWVQLLGDAIEYGGDHPELGVEVDPVDANLVRFVVRDNGPGLSEHERAQAFEEFTTLQPQRAGSRGLGLAVVNRIVSRHGGTLWIAGHPHGGSVVSFTLPAAPASDPPADG